MKKLLFIFSSVLLALFALGCYPKEREPLSTWNTYAYYVWENKSNHSITISLKEMFDNTYVRDSLLAPLENRVIAPQQYVTSTPDIGGYGYTWFPGGFFTNRYDSEKGSWHMILRFDDGTYGAIYGWERTDDTGYHLASVEQPASYDQDLDPTYTWNYHWSRVDNPEGCRQCSGRRYTYTFTDEDYAAAVARGPLEEEPAEPEA